MNVLRKLAGLAGCCAAGLAMLGTTGAAVVAERELLLRHTLGTERQAEVIVVPLRDLDVSTADVGRIKGVQVLDERGTLLVSQFDNLADELDSSLTEVAFEIDLPGSVRRVTVRLLDHVVAQPAVCTVELADDRVTVTTPAYTVPVRRDGAAGLWVEQPELKVADAQKLDDAMDAMLAGLDAPAPTAGGGRSRTAHSGANPPMGDRGLPFCVQGFPVLGQAGVLKARGGPVRAVVALADAGTWATGHAKTRYKAVQQFWFPRSGKHFFLEWRARFDDRLAPARLPFASLRVNSADHPWDLIMGQDGRRPYVAPVIVPLANTTKTPYLEPYQKSTFNHVWAQAVSAKGWVGVIVDTRGSRFGAVTNWGSGQIRLDLNMGFDDPGPFGASVQPLARTAGLPAGSEAWLRAMVVFGGAEDAPARMRAAHGGRPLARVWREEPGVQQAIDTMRATAARLLANPVVPRLEAAPLPAPDWERVRELAASRSVVVVTPDRSSPERQALWERLAIQLGGTWHPALSYLQHYNVTCRGRCDTNLLTVVIGEPGVNALLDQLNAEQRLFNPYPLEPTRATVGFRDAREGEGALLTIAGIGELATDRAVEEVIGQYGTAASRAAVIVSAYPWGDRMPYAWSGQKEHAGAFRTTAWRNGHAEFLLLLRTGAAIDQVTLDAPSGADVRVVPFRFESRSAGERRVVALHDAALPAVPEALATGSLHALWMSLPVAADTPPGMRRETARLAWQGGERELVLETEVLPVTLPDRRALGFYPMGFDAESLRQYFGWDQETYLARLPGLLRQLAPFGNTTYNLDVGGLRVEVDEAGQVTIDDAAFRRELEAVRAAGCIDLLMVDSFNHLWRKEAMQKLSRIHKLADDFEAWERVIPALRQTFRNLDLEDNLVCRHGDEIPDYEGWIGRAELYKRCGVRMSVAINGYGVFNKHLAVGTMGFWIPLYNFYLNRWGRPIPDDDFECFSKNFRDARKAAREPIWPYVCGPGPYAWSPRPRSQARFLMLDTFMKGGDGLSYYGGMVWSHALDPAFRKSDKADLLDTDATFTTLFYPVGNEIVPSLRAGAFRLGLEDATAVQAVRARAAAAGKADAVERELEAAYATLTMDAGEEAFDAFRRLLARLWLELER